MHDQVSDEYVLRLLINSSSIERILIAKTRADADSMLMQLGNGGVAWTADSYLVTRFPCVHLSLKGRRDADYGAERVVAVQVCYSELTATAPTPGFSCSLVVTFKERGGKHTY